MKIKTKIIAVQILMAIVIQFLPAISVAAPKKELTEAEKQDAQCKTYSKGLFEYGFKELTCAEIEQKDKENQECKNFSKNQEEYGKKALDCEQIKSVDKQREDEAEAEKVCQNEYKMSCSEYNGSQRMKSGQGFKVPLNFLTLKGKDGKRQGESIFQNKKYAEHGVFIGTLLRVIDILVYVIGSVALLTLIAGGLFMIANHGDEAWVTKGKDMMFYSILGLLFALLSFVFVNVVTSILS